MASCGYSRLTTCSKWSSQQQPLPKAGYLADCKCLHRYHGIQTARGALLCVRASKETQQAASEAAPEQQQKQQQQQQQQLLEVQQQDSVNRPQAAPPAQQKRDLLIPILVAICLAAYTLIAVLGFVDSLDNQQSDWQF